MENIIADTVAVILLAILLVVGALVVTSLYNLDEKEPPHDNSNDDQSPNVDTTDKWQ